MSGFRRPGATAMSSRDLALQLCQILAVLVFAPLLQGFILWAEERVQRSAGPSIGAAMARLSFAVDASGSALHWNAPAGACCWACRWWSWRRIDFRGPPAQASFHGL